MDVKKKRRSNATSLLFFVFSIVAENLLHTPIEYLKGVGPKRGELLRKDLNICTFEDLLQHYPFRYIDKSKIFKVNEIHADMPYIQLKGQIHSEEVIGKGRNARLTMLFTDSSGTLELVWFRGIQWMKGKFDPSKDYIVFGKPTRFGSKYNIAHPDVEEYLPETDSHSGRFEGIYTSTEKMKNKGLGTKAIAKLTKTLVGRVKGYIPETLSRDILQKLNLPSREEALIAIHLPVDNDQLKRARARLKLEELFFIQLKLLKYKLSRNQFFKGYIFSQVGDHVNRFYKENLPFELTNAQKRVIKEIRKDLGSGLQMNRLLQGDVGSGKTLVALMTMLIALDNGYQAALMAPTEILARQHYDTIRKFLGNLDIKVALLTGSTKASERNPIQEQLQDGTLNIIIGTHALIEDNVNFQKLGIVVIDEQHRFGVGQRARLWQKSKLVPHVLVMTATPIPRTLAMTLYGDLDVSVIDELPPGRKSVKTFHRYDSGRLRVFGFMKEQIKAGRQIYVVYPLIKESSKLDLKDLHDGYESISREFPLPDYAISILHGQMKAAQKEYEMGRFKKGETQILVATTVIEVGVDVPNASVMVIENAERFGLSQLHQLRGRVGRGADQSYCILMSKDKLSMDARKRIETMVNSSDGFEIAEADLRLRGPGDLQGTQQSGLPDLKLADLVKDEKAMKYARDLAIELLHDDPELQKASNNPIREHFNNMQKDQFNWSVIS